MKKIIATIATLLALSMAFVGCNTHAGDNTTDPKPDPAPEAPAVTPIECDMTAKTWGWGYNSSVENDTDGNLVITLSGSYGAGSFGYKPAKDLTGYTKMVVEIVSVTGADPWYQVIVQTDNDHSVKKDAKGTDANTLEVDLTSGTLDLTNVTQVSIQGKTKGDVIVVKSVTLK